MTKFVSNSRARSIISVLCAVAMLSSLIVVPAFAQVQSTASGLLGGTTALTTLSGHANSGIQGLVSVTPSITPGVYARQESDATYQTDAAKAETIGNRGVVSTTGNQQLRVGVISPRYNTALGLPAGTVFNLPIDGLTPQSSITSVVAAINSTFDAIVIPTQAGNAWPDFNGTIDTDAEKAWVKNSIRVVAAFQPTGQIRLTKTFCEGVLGGDETNTSLVWAFDNAPITDPSKGVADLIFGSSSATIDFDRSYRSAQWATGTAPITTDGFGTGAAGEALGTTVTPDFGLPFKLHYDCQYFGSIDSATGEFVFDVDMITGQYTAIRANDCGSGYDWFLSTGSHSQSVLPGTATFRLGNGARGDEVGNDFNCAPTVTPSTVPTAGAVATWTVTVPAPGDGYPSNLENAYNGVSILFPKEFNLVNKSDAAGFLTQLVADFGGTTPTVTATRTSEGDLVTLSNFVIWGGLRFQASLTSPQNADLESIGAKIWIHNVGSPWSASPAQEVLQNASLPDEGTDWVPVFCECGTVDMDVQPDLLKNVVVTADPNRAKGYTAVIAAATDQWGNDVSGWTAFGTPVITPTSLDNASITPYVFAPASWVWRLGDTPGVNTVKVVGDDTRTGAAENASMTVSFSNVGFGEPHKLVIMPSKTTYDTSDEMAVTVKLVDAQGNPTSWLDNHVADGSETDMIEIVANSENEPFPMGQISRSAFIHKGWSKSNFWPFQTGDQNFGWPISVGIGGPVHGPDSWTFSAKHHSGSVSAADFVTVNVLAEDPAIAGVADHIKVTAEAPAPAEYAENDTIYNNKEDEYPDSAFGWAPAVIDDASAGITLKAQIVDAYDHPITSNVANKPVTFAVPKFQYSNAILPTGHTYETTTNAEGIATVFVKSYSPTIANRYVPDWDGWSWFTPVEVDMSYNSIGTGWAYPCGGEVKIPTGYGFTYFHGAKLTADLEQTPEGDDKELALADGVDTIAYTATVMDSALLNTPIPGWDLKFTTSRGSFADGSKAVTTTTDAQGKASVVVKSAEAGDAYLRVYDRLHTTANNWNPWYGWEFFQNSVTRQVTFTDYKVVTEVIDATKRAGDRAEAAVRAWFQNIKTGQRVTWSMYNLDAFDDFEVYGYDVTNNHGGGINHVVWTNEADVSNWNVDTDGDGRFDAIEVMIPAYDDSGTQLESAGKRYAVIGGDFSAMDPVNQVFYNEVDFEAVPARPEVNFVKEATVQAEGTQLGAGISMVGQNFTPGRYAPDYSDAVDMYLGDIRTGETLDLLGTAWVGRDGSLLPVAVVNDNLSRMSPGTYDLTIDGLVFPGALVIKNLYKEAWISIDGKKTDVIYLNGGQQHVVQVNAFGAQTIDVWAGSLKLQSGDAVGRFYLPADSMDPGLHNMTAKIQWPTGDFFAVSNLMPSFDNYTTVVVRKYYIIKSLKFSKPTLKKSGRTLTVAGTVAGPAEADGSSAFAVTITVQKRVNGAWKKYSTKVVASNGAVPNAYGATIKVKSAGTYRVVVSHKDAAHPASSKTSSSVTVK